MSIEGKKFSNAFKLINTVGSSVAVDTNFSSKKKMSIDEWFKEFGKNTTSNVEFAKCCKN